MIIPISWCEPIFEFDEHSALIDRTLPIEVIKFALSHLGLRDIISTIQVSRNWHAVTLWLARQQDSKHYQMVKLFGERMGALCPQIPHITNKNFPLANNLAECNQRLIERREEVAALLASLLTGEELEKLESSALRIKKPKFFEILFEVAKKYQEFDKPECDDALIHISQELCTLGSFKKAMQGEGRVCVSKSARLFYVIAEEHCVNRSPDKALDIYPKYSKIWFLASILSLLFARPKKPPISNRALFSGDGNAIAKIRAKSLPNSQILKHFGYS